MFKSNIVDTGRAEVLRSSTTRRNINMNRNKFHTLTISKIESMILVQQKFYISRSSAAVGNIIHLNNENKDDVDGMVIVITNETRAGRVYRADVTIDYHTYYFAVESKSSNDPESLYGDDKLLRLISLYFLTPMGKEDLDSLRSRETRSIIESETINEGGLRSHETRPVIENPQFDGACAPLDTLSDENNVEYSCQMVSPSQDEATGPAGPDTTSESVIDSLQDCDYFSDDESCISIDSVITQDLPVYLSTLIPDFSDDSILDKELLDVSLAFIDFGQDNFNEWQYIAHTWSLTWTDLAYPIRGSSSFNYVDVFNNVYTDDPPIQILDATFFPQALDDDDVDVFVDSSSYLDVTAYVPVTGPNSKKSPKTDFEAGDPGEAPDYIRKISEYFIGYFQFNTKSWVNQGCSWEQISMLWDQYVLHWHNKTNSVIMNMEDPSISVPIATNRPIATPDLDELIRQMTRLAGIKTPPKFATKAIESLLLCVIGVITVKDKFARGIIITQFIHANLPGYGFTQTLINIISDSADKCADKVTSQVGDSTVLINLESQGFIDTLKDTLYFGKILRGTELNRHLMRVTGLLTAVYMCGTSKVETGTFEFERFCDTLSHTCTDKTCIGVIQAVLESVVYFYDKGMEFVRTRSIEAFSEVPTSLRAFERQYEQAVKMHPLAMNGNLQKFDFGVQQHSDGDKVMDHHTYMGFLESTIKLGTRAREECKHVRDWLSTVSLGLRNLQDMHNKYHIQRAQSVSRIRPFSMILSGNSGVGKSNFHPLLMHYVLEHNGYGHDTEQIITVDASAKFMDNAKGYTTGVILDDIANQRAETIAGGVSPCQTILNLVNNQPYLPNMSDVKQKAMIALEPLVVIGTTNQPNLDAQFWSNHPASITNRFDLHIEMVVKPEYRAIEIDNQGRRKTLDKLDPAKVPKYETGEIPDLWDFRFYHYVPCGEHGDGLARVNSMSYRNDANELCHVDWIMGAKELISFAIEMSARHFAKQKAHVLSSNSLSSKVRKCPICCRVGQFCICAGSDFTPEVDDGVPLIDTTEYMEVIENRAWFIPFLPNSIGESLPFQILFYYLFAGNLRLTRTGQIIICTTIMLSFVMCAIHTLRYTAMAWTLLCIYCYLALVKRQVTSCHRRLYANRYRVVAQQAYRSRKLFRIATGSVVVVAIYKLCAALLRMKHTWDVLSQGMLHPSDLSDIRERDNEVSPWTGMRVSPVLKVSKIMDSAVTLQKFVVDHCLRYIEMPGSEPDRVRGCNVFLLGRQYVLLPAHMWDLTSSLVCTLRISPNDSVERYVITLHPQYATPIMQDGVATDLLLVHVPSLQTARDTIDYFPLSRWKGSCFARMSVRKRDGELLEYESVKMDYVTKDIVIKGGIHIPHAGSYQLFDNTFPGMCMATFINAGTPPAILGFHLAGLGHTGICATLCKQDLTEAIAVLLTKIEPDTFVPHQANDTPIIVMGITTVKSSNVSHKHPVHHLLYSPATDVSEEKGIEGGAAIAVIGTTDSRVHYKSDVVESIISKDLCDVMHVPNEWGPPPLKGYGPWQKALYVMARPCLDIDPELLNHCTQDYLRDLVAIADTHMDRINVRPLTKREIINGIAGVRFIDAMNMKSSIGYPLSGAKMKYITEAVDDIGAYRRLDDTFFDEVARAEDILRSGQRVNFIFKACLKDEVVKKNKDKVRVFQACPIVLQLLMRKYFLGVARYLSTNPLVSECAVGINCYSQEWDELIHFIGHRDETGHLAAQRHIVAGDYSKYDLRMSAQLIRQAFHVIISLAMLSGNYTSQDVIVMRGLATEVSNAFLTFDGVLLLCSGSNPSGHNLTVYVNSIVNSLLFRVTYFYGNLKRPPFRSLVHLCTYGDDAFSGVTQPLAHFSISRHIDVMALYGIKFTLPDKSLDRVEYLALDDTDFLKRRARFNEEYGRWMAVLDYSSIMKSLHCTVRSTHISDVEQMLACMNSALMELFFHGYDVFVSYQKFFNNIIAARKWVIPKGSIFHVSYEEYAQRWLNCALIITPEVLPLEELELQQSTDYVLRKSKKCKSAYSAGNGQKLRVRASSPFVDELDPLSTSYMLIPNTDNSKSARVSLKCTHPPACVGDASILSEMDFSQFESHASNATIEACDMQLNTGLTTFVDSEPGTCVSYGGTLPPYEPGYDAHTSIQQWLSRPVNILNVSWAIGTALNQDINPLKLFLENPQVANRVNNYRGIRGTLHVKFIVNGGIYHYGLALAAWCPFSSTDEFAATDIVVLSQRSYVLLNPGESEGAQLDIPFFHFNDFINLQTETGADYASYGTIALRTVNLLKHMSGSTSALQISVFCWMDNAQLVHPTTASFAGLVAQSDEYVKVSTIASAAAQAAGKLSKIPIIGKYARASELALSTLGSTAALFGFSKPAVLGGSSYNHNVITGTLHPLEGPDDSYKLSADPRQEITVDPSVTGLSNTDEMSLASYVTRSSYYKTVTWTGGSTTGANIFQTYVSPRICNTVDLTGATYTYMSPMCHISHLMSGWRGDIEFTVQVISSSTVKGRLLISWDPIAHKNTSVLATNLTYSYVMDIAVENEVNFTIGWGALTPWLATGPVGVMGTPTANTGYRTDGVALTAKQDYCNGTLLIQVMTPLTAMSNTTSEAYVNIWMRGGTNLMFAGLGSSSLNGSSVDQEAVSTSLRSVTATPAATDGPLELQYFTSQSAEYTMAIGGKKVPVVHIDAPTVRQITFGVISKKDDHATSVCYGEAITSIRQLIKRYVLHRSIPIYGDTVPTWSTALDKAQLGGQVIVNLRRRFLPYYNGQTGDSTIPFKKGGTVRYNNYVNMTYLNYFLPCFAGFRGGVRYKHYVTGHVSTNIINSIITGNLFGSRIPPDLNANFSEVLYATPVSETMLKYARGTSSTSRIMQKNYAGQLTHSGTAWKPGIGQSVVETELPYQIPYKFSLARRKKLSTNDTLNCNNVGGILIQFLMNNQDSKDATNPALLWLNEFCAAADDFSLLYFTGVPGMVFTKDVIASL